MAKNKQGVMFLLCGEISYVKKAEPEKQEFTRINALHFLDHETVWPEDLEGMYKSLAMNGLKVLDKCGVKQEDIDMTGVVVLSISMMGFCSTEDWQNHSKKEEK